MNAKRVYDEGRPLWLTIYRDQKNTPDILDPNGMNWLESSEHLDYLRDHPFAGVIFFDFLWTGGIFPMPTGYQLNPDLKPRLEKIEHELWDRNLRISFYGHPRRFLQRGVPLTVLRDQINHEDPHQGLGDVPYLDGLWVTDPPNHYDSKKFLRSLTRPVIAHVSMDRAGGLCQHNAERDAPLELPENVGWRLWGESQEHLRMGDQVNVRLMHNHLFSDHHVGMFAVPSTEAGWWRANMAKWMPLLASMRAVPVFGPGDLPNVEKHFLPAFMQHRERVAAHGQPDVRTELLCNELQRSPEFRRPVQ